MAKDYERIEDESETLPRVEHNEVAQALVACGWFTDGFSMPTYDPGLGVACPFCARPLAEETPRKTISFLVKAAPLRSWFFRVHKRCWEESTEEMRRMVEHFAVDAAAQKVQ